MGSRRSTTSQKKSKERFKTLKAKLNVDCYNRGLGTCLAELKATKKALDASQTKIQELQNAHRRTTNALQELQNAHQRTINALWDAEDRVEELENHEVESISTLHRQIRKLRSENQTLKNPRNLLRSRSNLPDNNNNNNKKNQNNFFFK
ncbi:unnamed protein product [Rhizophagus irregularis]|nr:unnamed protein product [Rhizophagus irregularis]